MSDKDDADRSAAQRILVLIAASAFAGAGGNLGIDLISDHRPDPFTGLDGRQLEARISDRLDRIDERFNRLSDQVRQIESANERWRDHIIRQLSDRREFNQETIR